MNFTARQLKKVALKLGYRVKDGHKHLLIYGESGLISAIPRGRIKRGTLTAIFKQMGVTKDELAKLL